MSQEELDSAEAVSEELVEETSEEFVDSEESDSEDELSAEQQEELSDEVAEAIEEGATNEEVRQLVEKFKIKVNGKEKEVELDWNNKEDIIRRLQMAEAAPEALRAKAEAEKLFTSEIDRLRNNTWEVLEELGLDPDELAESRIARQIEELQKTPEQREQEARDRELQELRDKLKRQEEESERREFERLQSQAEVELEQEISEAISATTNLPKNAGIVRRVSEAMAWAMDNGRPDITAKEVLPIIEKEYNEEINKLLEDMPEKVLENFLRKNVTEKLRKQRLAKMPTKKKIVDTGSKPKEEQRKKISVRDFAKNGFSK